MVRQKAAPVARRGGRQQPDEAEDPEPVDLLFGAPVQRDAAAPVAPGPAAAADGDGDWDPDEEAEEAPRPAFQGRAGRRKAAAPARRGGPRAPSPRPEDGLEDLVVGDDHVEYMQEWEHGLLAGGVPMARAPPRLQAQNGAAGGPPGRAPAGPAAGRPQGSSVAQLMRLAEQEEREAQAAAALRSPAKRKGPAKPAQAETTRFRTALLPSSTLKGPDATHMTVGVIKVQLSGAAAGASANGAEPGPSGSGVEEAALACSLELPASATLLGPSSILTAALEVKEEGGRLRLNKASVSFPCRPAWESLASLLEGGHASLAYTDGGPTPCLLLCLSLEFLEQQTPMAPDEIRTRIWQKPLLEVISWLRPEAFAPPPADRAAGPAMEGRPESFASDLFAAIKPAGTEAEAAERFPGLVPSLRPYQRRAVAWMLARERGEGRGAAGGGEGHPLWNAVAALDPETGLPYGAAPPGDGMGDEEAAAPVTFFLNPYTGSVAAEAFEEGPGGPTGGILGDEMGLGKTVELLALIVSNPYRGAEGGPAGHTPLPAAPGVDQDVERRERVECVCGADDTTDESAYTGLWVQCKDCLAWLHGPCVGLRSRRQADKVEFVCGRCKARLSRRVHVSDARTTLVVCPAAILPQWEAELARHVAPGSLRVRTYLGQDQQQGGLPGTQVLTADELAASDVVLTTYDVLRRDLPRDPDDDGTGIEGRGSSRFTKKYPVIATPLTRLRFWRVCLDEAQMVESSTARAAEMASRLRTVHRWCITGTPCSRGLEDIHGLMCFLRVDPWMHKAWFSRALQHPLAPQEADEAPVDGGVLKGPRRAGLARRASWLLMRALDPKRGGLLWRSRKVDVSAELGIPGQFEGTTFLRLNAIERHFYSKQHQAVAKVLRETLPMSLQQAGARQHNDDTAAAAAAAAAIRRAGGDPEPASQQPEAITPGRLKRASGDGEPGPSGFGPHSPQNTAFPAASSARVPAAVCPTSAGIPETPVDVTLVTAGADKAARVSNGSSDGGDAEADPDSNRALTDREASKVLRPLLRLRQACIHPQVGSAGLKPLLASGPGGGGVRPMPMWEILDVLVDKARLECEEHLRLCIMSLNGLAGLQLLEQPPDGAGAVRAYRECLALEARCLQDGVRADPLQRLHTRHHLNALLEGPNRPEGVAPTLRDAGLRAEEEELKNAYIAEARAGLTSEDTEYLRDGGIGVRAALPKPNTWLDVMLMTLADYSVNRRGDEEVARLKQQVVRASGMENLGPQYVNQGSMCNRFTDLMGLRIVLGRVLEDGEKAKKVASDEIEALRGICEAPPEQLVRHSGRCERCRPDMAVRGVICRHCKADETIMEWEVHLFALFARKGGGGEDQGVVDIKEALRLHQKRQLNRVDLGGLGQGAALEGLEDEALEADAASTVRIHHRPSEAEMLLKGVLGMYEGIVEEWGDAGQHSQVLLQAKAHLEALETQRKVFFRARSLMLAQRRLLYSLDEADMALLRLSLLEDWEAVPEGPDRHLRLHQAEVPVRSVEYTQSRQTAGMDLTKALGTLRYLKGLKAASERGRKAEDEGAGAGESGPSGTGGAAAAAKGAEPDVEVVPAPPEPAAAAAAQGLNLAALHAERRARLEAQAAPAEPAATPMPAGPPTAAAAAAARLAEAPDVGPSPLGPADEWSNICVVCREELGAELVLSPCGHALCCRCQMALLDKVPPGIPLALRKFRCPTCRRPTLADDLAYVSDPTRGGNAAGTQGTTAAEAEAAAAGQAGPVYASGVIGFAIGQGGLREAAGGQDAAPGPEGPLSPRKARAAAPPPVFGPALLAAEASVEVKGSYGTKLEAVLRRIIYLTRLGPRTRILVFSSWTEALDLLTHGLGANGVAYAAGKSGRDLTKAIQRFKQSALPSVEEDPDGENMRDEEANLRGDGAGPGPLSPEGRALMEVDGEEGNGADTAAPSIEATPVVANGGGAAAVAAAAANGNGAAHRSPSNPDEAGGAGMTPNGRHPNPVGSPRNGPRAHGELRLGAKRALFNLGGEEGADGAAVGAGGNAHAGGRFGRGGKRRRVGGGRVARAADRGPVQVLLLPFQHGANGLNLTEAQHVVLLEPLLEPGVEAQAVGRVHRMGQAHETFVHRFVVVGTVEEKAAALCRERAARMDLTATPSKQHGAKKNTSEQRSLTVRDVGFLVKDAPTPVPRGSVIISAKPKKGKASKEEGKAEKAEGKAAAAAAPPAPAGASASDRLAATAAASLNQGGQDPANEVAFTEGVTGSTSGIRLENIAVTFKNQQILKSVSWEVKKGERVGLVGVNGAGKTTQLQVIMGNVIPDSGSLVRAKAKMRIAYLKQEFDVVGTRTVREEFLSVYSDQMRFVVRMEEIQRELETTTDDMDRMSALLDELDALQKKGDALDLGLLDKKLDQMMPELGFGPEDNDRLVASYSGGWQMRMMLGKLLLMEPDLLLLDEPTNHIDVDTIEWLEGYLKKQEVPMVIVSHDRMFLDKLCTKIVETERGTAHTYLGNYTQYVVQKEERAAQQWAAYEKQQKEISKQREIVARLSGGGQSGRAAQAQKTLEKIAAEGLVEKPFEPKRRQFRFPVPEDVRCGEVVLELDSVTHGYGDSNLFEDANLEVRRGERVALMGPNGVGKSTLLRLLRGIERPKSGRASLGQHNIIPNFFEQNQAEALDLGLTVLSTLQRAAPDAQLDEIKALLGQMMFSGKSMDKKVSVLSGGEKARLALAKFMLTPATLLILDEPTNHLDIPSKEMLEEALARFDGAVIVVSHDRYFLRKVATRIVTIEDGQLIDYEGDYEDFLEKNEDAAEFQKEVDQEQRELEKSMIKAKSRMSKAQKALLKKDKAREFNQAASEGGKKN